MDSGRVEAVGKAILLNLFSVKMKEGEAPMKALPALRARLVLGWAAQVQYSLRGNWWSILCQTLKIQIKIHSPCPQEACRRRDRLYRSLEKQEARGGRRVFREARMLDSSAFWIFCCPERWQSWGVGKTKLKLSGSQGQWRALRSRDLILRLTIKNPTTCETKLNQDKDRWRSPRLGWT